ncbi:MAG: FeoA family protein [Bifidobacterium sp.]|nr:FeoA family protein [Bifidobacterium sp.]
MDTPTDDTTLDACPLQQDMTVTRIAIDERHRFRMLELGWRAGCTIRVTQRSNFGGRVVAKGTERIAIDGWTARRIHVRPNLHRAAPDADIPR